jgi:hypothetical protein
MGLGLENLAEDLEFAVRVGRVGQLGVEAGSAFQNWFHVLENANTRFAVVRTHAALANSAERKVWTGDV